VFDQSPKYHMKSMLRDFNEKVGKEDNSEPRVWKENLYETGSHNGVTVEKFATSETVIRYFRVAD